MHTRIFLSLLFLIVSTLSVAHETEHIMSPEAIEQCSILHISQILDTTDPLELSFTVEYVYVSKISLYAIKPKVDFETYYIRNRAPPFLS